MPLSTTPPERNLAYVVEIELAPPLPAPFDAATMWAKCDMVATVGFERLDLFRDGRGSQGKRRYMMRRIDPDMLERIRAGVRAGLGI